MRMLLAERVDYADGGGGALITLGVVGSWVLGGSAPRRCHLPGQILAFLEGSAPCEVWGLHLGARAPGEATQFRPNTPTTTIKRCDHVNKAGKVWNSGFNPPMRSRRSIDVR